MAFNFESCFSKDGSLFDGLVLVKTKRFDDQRGSFMESWNQKSFSDAGLRMNFVQDNISVSKKAVLRGLHFQKTNVQGKLVRCIKGSVLDVVVDLRNGQASFGKSYSVILSEENANALYIPEGFAHGFLTLSDTAVFSYKCSALYCPESESGILYNSPALDFDWFHSLDEEFKKNLVVNEKDLARPVFDPQKNYFNSDGIWIGE